MSRNRLPQVSFETGILVHRSIFAWPRTDSHRLDYFLIGKAGETPFLLAYRGGITSWWCQERLGESLRKKILGVLREEIRYGESMPDYQSSRREGSFLQVGGAVAALILVKNKR